MTNGCEYTFELRAVKGTIHGASSRVTATPGNSAPGKLKAAQEGNTVVLTWSAPLNDVASVEAYEVHYQQSRGGSGIITTASTATRWVDVDASYRGPRITYRVRAQRGSQYSAWSNRVSIDFVSPPSAPDSLRATRGDGEVLLEWDDPEDAGITGYELRYEESTAVLPETWSEMADSDSSTTEYTVQGLTNGTQYTFEVRAVNGAGPGDASSVTSTPGPPAAPDGLSASAGDEEVLLEWDDPEDVSITGYQARYGPIDTTLPEWSDEHNIDGSNAGTTRHPATNLTNGTEYTFEVRATNTAGPGDASSVTSRPGPPAAPDSLMAMAGVGAVGLTWANPRDGGITSYELRYGDDDGSLPAWSVISGSSDTTTSHPVPDLINGTVYTFEVRATNAVGAGDSSRVKAIPVPAAPVRLEATAGDSSVTLTWADPEDDGVTGHQLRQGDSTTVQTAVWSDIPDSASNMMRYVVQALTNGTLYEFELRAKAGSGDDVVYGASSSVSACPQPSLPAPPSSLTATPGNMEVSLAWDDPGDDAIYRFEILHRPSDTETEEWSSAFEEGANVTTHTVEALTNGRKYTFRVRAWRRVGAKAQVGNSALAMATPVPAAPANLSAAAGVRAVALSWTDPGDDGITAYQIRHGDSTSVLTADWRNTAVTTSDTVRNLTSGRKYTFEVRAQAGVVHGDSSSAMATPVPARPGNLRALPGDTKVTLRWTDPSDDAVNGYQYHYFSGNRPAAIAWRDTAVTTSHPVTGLTNGTRYTFEVRAKAGIVHSDTSTAMATPTAAPPPPPPPPPEPPPTQTQPLGIMCPADTIVTVGGSIRSTASAWEGDPPYTFSQPSVTPSGLSLDISTAGDKGTVTGTATSAGDYTVTVTVNDGDGAPASCGFNVTVRRRPCPPIEVSAGGNMTVKAGSSIARTATAEGGGSHSFSLSVTPSAGQNLSIGGTNGEITGSVSQAGTYTVTVYAQVDGAPTHCTPASDSFTITVCDPVEIDPISNQKVVVGNEITITPVTRGGCGSPVFSMTGALPPGVTFDTGTGVISGTVGGSANTYDVTVKATDPKFRENTASSSFTLTVICPTISVAAGADVAVAVNGNISRTVTASGSGTSYDYTLSIEPASGLDLSIADGRITGSASKAGAYTVTVNAKATNARSCPAGSDQFTVTVECPDISVGGLSNVTVIRDNNMPSMTASASGGETPYGFTMSGAPGTVGINATSGVISGNVGDIVKTYTVTVTATDDCGCTGTGEFEITVSCPTITVGGLRDETVEVLQSLPSMTATASGGQSPYTFRRESGPVWVNVSTGGAISGRAPGETGTYLVTVKATDAGGCWGTKTFEVRVVTPPLKIRNIADVEATVGKPMPARAASASGGKPPYVFSMSGKPSWVSFNASTGRIGGTPRSTGTSTATVTVTDDDDNTATTAPFQLRVSSPLTVAAISNVVVTWQLDMDPVQVSASGGRGAYTYSLESPPAGISISSSGSIGGTPTQLGSAKVTVVVDDEDDRRATTSFTMTVALPGDFNGDGRRDAADAKMFNRMMGLRRSDAGYDRRMDLNGDGTINYADFVILTGYIESDASSQSGL